MRLEPMHEGLAQIAAPFTPEQEVAADRAMERLHEELNDSVSVWIETGTFERPPFDYIFPETQSKH